MALMNQGDIFLCVNKIFRIGYEKMSVIISDMEGTVKSKDTAWLNRCANQHVPGDEIFRDMHTEFYKKFFESGRTSEEENNIMAVIREWLAENNLTFPGMNDSEKYDSPEKWLMQMIKCALQNWTSCRAPVSRKKNLQVINYMFPASKFFIGRREFISSIKNAINEKRIVILTGTAGMGKSALAHQFAEMYARNYTAVQEIIADSAGTDRRRLLHDMIRKISFSGLNLTKAKNEDEVFSMKMDALRKIKSPVLLIFDGLEATPKDFRVLTDILKDNSVQIIITARNLQFLDSFPNLRVTPLAEYEQIQLFEHYFGRKIAQGVEMKYVKDILQYCDGGTLYIEHLARYISMRELTFEEACIMLQECDPFPDSWYVQKDGSVFSDETFYGTFLKILFPNSVTPMRKKVLKILSLLPNAGVSRRMIFKVLGKTMQDELISLENEGYVMCEIIGGKRITRLTPILQNLVRWAFFDTEKDCGDFMNGLCSFMSNSTLENIERDIYAVALKILTLMNFSEFDIDTAQKWINSFGKFFTSHQGCIEDYEKDILCKAVGKKLETLMRKE